MKVIYLFFKRFFDIMASFFALVLLLVPFAVIAVVIKCTSKGPVFFKQKRVGKNKKLFTILKFRTMRVDAPKDTATHLLGNADSYITGVGKFLRKTSIDELPQIFNIFVGHMSVIGPRPALYNQYDLVELRDKYNANGVRPGLTGLAQIRGRDELELDVKARLDGEYVEKMSLWLDIKIFFKTLLSVFKSDGVVEGGTGAMAKAVKENSLTAFNPENDAKAEEVSEEKVSEENVTEAADGNNAENQSDADFDACSVPSNDADETQGNGSVDFASAPREINAGGESVNNCQPEENADMNARKDSVLSDSGADSDALKNQSDAMEAEAESVLSAFVDACCYGGQDKKDADSLKDDNSLKEEKDR